MMYHPSGTSLTPAVATDSGSGANLSATTTSSGRCTATPSRSARRSTSRANSSRSSSTGDAPTGLPVAARKVTAMPPPMNRWSSRGSRFSNTRILSLTLAPPMSAASGRSGSASASPSDSTSRCVNRPIAEGSRLGSPTVDAWARCATAKASITKQSASDARSLLNESSFFSSPVWNRRFSSR